MNMPRESYAVSLVHFGRVVAEIEDFTKKQAVPRLLQNLVIRHFLVVLDMEVGMVIIPFHFALYDEALVGLVLSKFD